MPEVQWKRTNKEGNMKGNTSKQMAPFNQALYYGPKVQSS